MGFPSTSATFVPGSIPAPDFPADVPPPVLQATDDSAQRTTACKVRLFMTVSGRGEPRTLSGRGSYVNKRETLGVPESQPRRDQGAPPADQDGGGSGPFQGSRPA